MEMNFVNALVAQSGGKKAQALRTLATLKNSCEKRIACLEIDIKKAETLGSLNNDENVLNANSNFLKVLGNTQNPNYENVFEAFVNVKLAELTLETSSDRIENLKRDLNLHKEILAMLPAEEEVITMFTKEA